MLVAPANTKVYLAAGITDMRKAINGLSMLVEGQLALDPFSGHLFVFWVLLPISCRKPGKFSV